MLGRVDYAPTFQAMKDFAVQRLPNEREQLWICEHSPVFTLGLAGRPEHVLAPGDIPVVPTDRGGQVTYHGPGQAVAYVLVDLARLGIYVKEHVYRLEHGVLQVLARHGVTGHRVVGAPGVYVRLDDPYGHALLVGPPAAEDRWRGLGKVAALGVKVTRGRAYHGVALNVAMDLKPFAGIDPCGYAGLQTVDLAALGVGTDWPTVATQLGEALARQYAR